MYDLVNKETKQFIIGRDTPKALAKRLDICTEHSVKISHVVQCVNIEKGFGCGKTTENLH